MDERTVKWEELGLSNDFLFGKVMKNPELCREMLETILGIEIERLEYPEAQKNIDEDKDSRGVRLDLYVKDQKGEVFNVEVQALDTGELPKRSRYYSSMIDIQELNKGVAYWKLKRSYVIFICTFDLFKRGRHVYTFENRCREERELTLGDEAFKIFLNTRGVKDDVSGELKEFLDYVGGKEPSSLFTKKLEEEVRKAKKNREWRREYMTLLMRDQENLQKGIEQGLKQGIKQGREQGLKQGREQGMKQGREQGLKQGENRLAELTKRLMEENRYNDIKLVIEDTSYRQELYQKYHINT